MTALRVFIRKKKKTVRLCFSSACMFFYNSDKQELKNNTECECTADTILVDSFIYMSVASWCSTCFVSFCVLGFVRAILSWCP